MTTTELSTPNPASLADASPVPRRWVARVFERLTAQLGAKVADMWVGVNERTVQEEWGAGLAGFHETEIQRGIAACRERAFAPTLGEFLRLCRPALDPEWAFYEAADGLRQRDEGQIGAWSHPAVWRAACSMGMEVRSGDWKAHRTRWTYALKRELAAGWGGGVKPPAMRIDHTVTVRGPTAKEREALASLRSAAATTGTAAEA